MHTTTQTHEIEKEALNAFVFLSTIVFWGALSYCYLTDHYTEIGAITIGLSIISALVIHTYRSFNKS